MSHPFINNSGLLSFRNIKRMGDIEVSLADRQPCLVCGHPTGDCTGAGDEKPITKLHGQINGTEPMILVEQDVTEERAITPYTKTRVVIHRRGDYISLSRAKEIGLTD